jgi:hypothetical protein
MDAAGVKPTKPCFIGTDRILRARSILFFVLRGQVDCSILSTGSGRFLFHFRLCPWGQVDPVDLDILRPWGQVDLWGGQWITEPTNPCFIWYRPNS